MAANPEATTGVLPVVKLTTVFDVIILNNLTDMLPIMQIASSQIIPPGQSTPWGVLMDPEVLKARIPGCESIENTGNNSNLVVMQAQ